LRRIVIDPGHGGFDPGARASNGLAESVVTLDVARRLADEIARTMGVQVVLTRDADVFVPLEDRAARANAVSADLFVSIHCNSSENALSRGVSTYVLDTTSDSVAARVARREEGEVASDPLSNPEVFRILANLRLLGQASPSMHLADEIQHSLVTNLGRVDPNGATDLGIHPARFNVLVGARMPAVLVELPFLSNASDAAHMRNPAFRAVLSHSIAEAVARFAP
jgi:N-acetylmuramoyl-L-alanine amidase